MLYRNPVIIVFPVLLLTWYLVARSWPPRESFQVTPLYPDPAPTLTSVTASTPAVVLISTVTVTATPILTPTPTPTPTPSSASTPTLTLEVESENPIENPIEKYAYVFYATTDEYACSALVNYHRLRTVLKSKIPVILLASSGISDYTVQAIKHAGVEVIRDEPPPLAPGGAAYYDDVLLKLRALRLQIVKPKLERIQILDADQLILKNLDKLFELPQVEIAAPLAYWQQGTGVTTTLIVAELSLELWQIVDAAIKTIGRDEYDMDLVNRVFKKRLMVLPGRYCTLNSHWESLDLPGWFGNVTRTRPAQTPRELVALYEDAEVLHFTAMGKPWSVVLGDIITTKPLAHPLFRAQFNEWKTTAKEVCVWNPMYGN